MSRKETWRYRCLLVVARFALWWEQLWPRLWPVVGVVGVFAAVALADLLPALPGWLHIAVLALFGAAVVGSLSCSLRGWRSVDRADARHRLERDSGCRHRPLTALEDRLAAGVGDPAAEALWRLHVQRLSGVASDICVRPPSPGMARREPFGIRAIVMLLLIIGLAAGAREADVRFERALLPRLTAEPQTPPRAEIWITPPAYTRMAPLFLRWVDPDTPTGPSAASALAADGIVRVPAGSALLAQASGVGSPPTLSVGTAETTFAAISDRKGNAGYQAETVIGAGEHLAIRTAGRDLARWRLQVIADTPPEVGFASVPVATADASFDVAYRAVDDYGVIAVTAVLRRTNGPSPATAESEIRLPLPLSLPGAEAVDGRALHDLAAHSWAGHPVHIHLEAEDAAGQIGYGAGTDFVLPERSFAHPVARALIAERKRLDDGSAESRTTVADVLAEIATRPDHFANDLVVSLALAVATSRLLHDRTAVAVPSVRDLLWETALRIEHGDVPMAEQRFRDLSQRLWEALRRDAEQAEIERLLDELSRALDEYLAAVAAEMSRKGIPEASLPPSANVLRSDDLKNLIEMAREMALSGARDGARRLLGELQRLLDDLRAGLNASQSAKELLEAQRLMNALRALGDEQQKLLDQTYRRLQQLRRQEGRGQPGESDATAGEKAAGQQRLRHQLGDLMLNFDALLGGIPGTLGKADRAMKRAVDALDKGRLGDAIPGQTEAVDLLRQAAEQAGRMLAERIGAFPGVFAEDPDESRQGQGDPFGRFGGGNSRGFSLGDVRIPDQMEMRRVEEILRELRRRAGEIERPRLERLYIDRLLRRF